MMTYSARRRMNTIGWAHGWEGVIREDRRIIWTGGFWGEIFRTPKEAKELALAHARAEMERRIKEEKG